MTQNPASRTPTTSPATRSFSQSLQRLVSSEMNAVDGLIEQALFNSHLDRLTIAGETGNVEAMSERWEEALAEPRLGHRSLAELSEIMAGEYGAILSLPRR
ncbi:hypothetical protein [Ralstonia phage BHDT_So9]|uniref:Uncharacterized protein n=1 Tax=Ralstonia phage BHDT_So9 TaxID=2972464 RepID=A0A9E7U654_9CAUD|nr:hypothetical protein [Ralstonia phage BHDT_So9]UWI83524.1 hypothetical protein [Ralstonia phage DLDT_So2]UZT26912.1 hypothetical protein [Ralstonia phage BHDTSo81]WEM03440.1 hypothetical protein [Ralstonia phage BHDT8]